jgi:hypothetical protein
MQALTVVFIYIATALFVLSLFRRSRTLNICTAVAAGIAIALFIAWGIMRNFDMSSEILKTGYIF